MVNTMRKDIAARKKIHEKPDVLIGKNGVTENLLNEIKNQLEKKKTIKIKALKTIAQTKKDFKEILQQIQESIQIEVLDIRGKTAIIRKKRRKYQQEKI